MSSKKINEIEQLSEIKDEARLVLNKFLQMHDIKTKTSSAPSSLTYNVKISPKIKSSRSLNNGQIHAVNKPIKASSKKNIVDKVKDQFLSVLKNKQPPDKNKKPKKSIDLKKYFSVRQKKKQDNKDLEDKKILGIRDLEIETLDGGKDSLDEIDIRNSVDHIVPPSDELNVVPFHEQSDANKEKLINYAAEILDRIADEMSNSLHGTDSTDHSIHRSPSTLSLRSLSNLVNQFIPNMTVENFDWIMNRWQHLLHGTQVEQLAILFMVGRQIYNATGDNEVSRLQALVLGYFNRNFAHYIASIGGWAGLDAEID